VRDAQLFRAVIVDALLDALGLLVGHQAAGADRPAAALAGQGAQALRGVGRPPTADGFVADSQEVGEVQFRVTQFDTSQGAQAQDLKGFIGQLASVW
jgi:hypothetical protein